MYGSRVHEAVLKNNETETGITIHLVNQNYDEGEIIKQYVCGVSKTENLSSLENKIHKLEFDNFPKTLEKYILKVKVLMQTAQPSRGSLVRGVIVILHILHVAFQSSKIVT